MGGWVRGLAEWYLPEVRLLGRAALHSLVVGMQMGVVVDLQSLGVERRRDLLGAR